MSEEKSVGEKRVRMSFNPSESSLVYQLKSKTAELINICEQLKTQEPRWASEAQTNYETAVMYAVKAATC